jgi:hypothetical protein
LVTVSYEYRFEYTHDPDGRRFPRLEVRVASPEKPAEAVDVWAYLDSGAERSLFNGWIGAALGIDILDGPTLVYETGSGAPLSATLHPVRLFHPDLGDFDLEVGMSSSEIPRNLLGRDFFDLVQIGFREHHLAFYLTPSP